LREKDEPRREPLLDPFVESAEAASIAFASGVESRPAGKEVPSFAALGSLGLHLVLLLALFLHPLARSAPPALPPIPVTLVMVKPPPKPAPRPAPKPPPPQRKPPAGRLASVRMGEKAHPPAHARAAPQRAPASPTPPAAAEPRKPPPKAASETAMAVPLPLPKPPAPKPARPAPAQRRPLAPARAEALPEYPGPSATRSAYLAYLAALIHEHVGLLPRSMVGNRRGVSVIGITVRDDGTIARLFVLKSSGYPDIDRRVEMMVAAVGRFPPLPQLWQGPQVVLDLHLPFPEALAK
jgi:TonB family protein